MLSPKCSADRAVLRVVRLLTQSIAFSSFCDFYGWKSILLGIRKCISSIDAEELESLGFAGIVDFVIIINNLARHIWTGVNETVKAQMRGDALLHFGSTASLWKLVDEMWPRNERRSAWGMLRRISGFSDKPIPSDASSVISKAGESVEIMMFSRKCATFAASRLLALGPVCLGAVVNKPDKLLWSWLLKSTSYRTGMLGLYLAAHWRVGTEGAFTSESLVPYLDQIYEKLATRRVDVSSTKTWRDADPLVSAVRVATFLWLDDEGIEGLEVDAQAPLAVLRLLLCFRHGLTCEATGRAFYRLRFQAKGH